MPQTRRAAPTLDIGPSHHHRFVDWAAANLLVSWYLALIIDIIPTFIRFLISVVWGHVSERIKTRIEMYNSA
ncbi:hypothetical protein B0H19DRAFT_1150288 [Mycena capillaripes]|nr:hypothetical protein B0H19DRAFT_1150288 [Mycena capillaripes]